MKLFMGLQTKKISLKVYKYIIMKLKEEMLKHVATWEKFTNRVCFFLKI